MNVACNVALLLYCVNRGGRDLRELHDRLESGGFSIDTAHHGLHVLGSRVFGFTQDPFNDTADVRPDAVTAAAIAEALGATYPSVGRLAMATSHDGGLGGCDDDFEFAFGLDLILDGLERLQG